MLEIVIDNRDYDLLAKDALIQKYCIQHDLPSVLKYRIRLVFEELVEQIHFPVLGDPKILFSAEYSPADHKVARTVRYNGPVFDPGDSENTISYAVIKGMVTDISHTAEAEEGYTNRFQCVIRGD